MKRAPNRLPEKLYRMADLVEFTGLSRQMLHNYIVMGLIKEKKRTAGGHRLFGREVFGRLSKIARMRRRGKSLLEIAEKLRKEEGVGRRRRKSRS